MRAVKTFKRSTRAPVRRADRAIFLVGTHGDFVCIMYCRAESAAEGVRVIRDGSGFSVKLLTVIDELVSGFVESIAGAGNNKSRGRGLCTQELEDEQRMSNSVSVATIDSHEGWEFAFEGGAHILFRHTAGDRQFVLNPSLPDDFMCWC